MKESKGFIVTQEAWYSKNLPKQEDQIMIGLYCSDGGTKGEFAIRWKDIGQVKKSPRLEVYSDALEVFSNMPEFIPAIKELGEDFTPTDVKKTLKKLGYKDLTERTLTL